MKATGVHHIVMTVSDVERSSAFYKDVLEFDVNMIGNGGAYFAAGDVLCFMYPARTPLPDDRFSEERVGLDHLSFTMPTREGLDEMAAKLMSAGVDTKGVEQFAPTGDYYIALRDPDNIQLEFWLA